MTSATSMTRKGQVTIPVAVRRILRLSPGDRVTFEVDPETGTATIRRLQSIRDVYGLVSPRERPEDFARLREEFERGVAEEVMTETQMHQGCRG